MQDSDATLILNVGELDGGTLQTLQFTERMGKPHRVVQLDQCVPAEPADRITQWLIAGRIYTLNVAGPSEEKRPGIYALALFVLERCMASQEEFQSMTAQISEKLIFEGQQLAMCTNPLSLYFARGGDGPDFKYNCTALWRGYVGTWEIFDGRLYLIELHGTLEGGGEASVGTIFPDYPDRVFAHWYSGTIRIPQGKLLNYVHKEILIGLKVTCIATLFIIV